MIPQHTSLENEFYIAFSDEHLTLQDAAHHLDVGKNTDIYFVPKSIQNSSASSIISTSAHMKSAVGDLPDDLLIEIFMACRGEEGIEVGEKDIIDRVAEVNKRWRGVVLCESRLWARFILKLEGNLSSRQQHLHTLLDRSRNSPLTFILEILPKTATYGQVDSGIREHMLKKLALHSERWQTVTFRGPLMYGYADALKNAKGKLGQLKSASFTTRPSGHILTTFETAPVLSELAFKNFDDPIRHMLLPWKQITRLSMGPTQLFMGNIVNILRRCPALEELEWMGDCTLITEYESFEAPHLRILKIESGTLYLRKMLDAISAPALKTLDVALERSVEFGQGEIANAIILFLVRSCCAINTLSLGSLLGESVIRILQEYPIIENLELKSVIFTPNLEAQLIWLGHGIQCIAPNLRSLVLRGCFITCTELEKIVRSRIAGKCHTCLTKGIKECKPFRLRRVFLYGVQYYDKSVSRAEASLQYRFRNQTGLDFNIR